MNREVCFEKLEQFVLDENKIVTYKSLSQQLKIPLNEAKLYLSDFVIQQEKEDNHLNATYFLSGILNKDGVKTLKVCVVPKKLLEKKKEEFLEVTGCHIYSVSRNGVDECALYNVDQQFNKNRHQNSEFAVIKHPNLVKKEPILTKMSALKIDEKPPAPKKKETLPLKNKVLPAEKKNMHESTKSNGTEKAVSKTPETPTSNVQEKKPSSSESKNQKSNTLASMWQKSEDMAKKETSKPEGKAKTKTPQETKKGQKNSIMSMFSKQAAKNAQNSPRKTPVSDPVSNKNKESPPECKSSATETVEKPQQKKPSISANKKRKINQRATKSSVKQKNESDSGDENPKKKKHRRIVAFEDSDDSESENEEIQDKAQRSLYLPEDPVEQEPKLAATPGSDDSEEPIPPTPPVVLNKGKKKICKTVNNTFVDEDGFMVTKQETQIVMESDSDEDPLPSKDEKKKETPIKALSMNRKQASLTNFFKRS